jgi:hypothetical protein
VSVRSGRKENWPCVTFIGLSSLFYDGVGVGTKSTLSVDA